MLVCYHVCVMVGYAIRYLSILFLLSLALVGCLTHDVVETTDDPYDTGFAAYEMVFCRTATDTLSLGRVESRSHLPYLTLLVAYSGLELRQMNGTVVMEINGEELALSGRNDWRPRRGGGWEENLTLRIPSDWYDRLQNLESLTIRYWNLSFRVPDRRLQWIRTFASECVPDP